MGGPNNTAAPAVTHGHIDCYQFSVITWPGACHFHGDFSLVQFLCRHATNKLAGEKR